MQQSPQLFLQAAIGAIADDNLADVIIEDLIVQRAQAKTSKDFARADEIRIQLKDAGIELEDSPTGTTWRRV